MLPPPLFLLLQAAALGSSPADSLLADFRTYCLAGPSISAAVQRLEGDGWTEDAATGDPTLTRFFSREQMPAYAIILHPKKTGPDNLANCVASNPEVDARDLIKSVSAAFGRPAQNGQRIVWPRLESGVEIQASILTVNGGADGRVHLDLAAHYGGVLPAEQQG